MADSEIKTVSDTREAWLLSCISKLRNDFIEVGSIIPDKVRASCGWPSKSGLAQKKRRIGEAWSASCSGDETFEVFISPVLKDGRPVLATLVHELVHCAVGVEKGHKGPFKKIALAIGLEGKMTDTTAGEKLIARIDAILAEVGSYPHAELKSSNAPKKQGTRMLLVKCPECEYQVRTTKKWLEVGVPTCPCGTKMEAEESEEGEDEGGGDE
jgi:hypothetical protein